ncbi:MAG: hypothetical protein H6832_07620 [Planctomycetes bacterium]|nr:hypothetical protein [Planctomycetota bacterium]MCB9918257.1 hypothetical protein [Planctomycetota bacterium]
MKLIASLVFSAVLAAPVAAQACSKLDVSGTGKPGTDLGFALTGADANVPAILFLSTQTGKTTIKVGPLGTLELGLAMPLIPVPLGMTDDKGAASLTVKIPDAKIPEISLHGQATSVKFELKMGPPKLTFCTSNVVDFKIGG